MVTVQNRIFDASGSGIEGVEVVASLATPGYLDDGTIVSSVSTTSAATTGLWSLDLPPNTDINPAGTHYRIKEAGRVSAIVVPDSAGPHEMTDLLVAAPEDPDSVTVGVTSVDGRDGIVILSDLYAALAHASRHESGGADELTDVIHTNATTDFLNFDDFIAIIDQADDSATEPDTALWSDRFELRFRGQLVQWWNEFLEWRGAPAYPANDGTGVGTVGWRLFAALSDTAYNARDEATPVWEVTNFRSGAGSGTSLASINHLGEFRVIEPDWQNIPLETGFVTGDSGTPQWRFESAYNLIRLQGSISNPAGILTLETMGTLPAEASPPSLWIQAIRVGTQGKGLHITAAGELQLDDGIGGGGSVRLHSLTIPLS